jgi:hypothetical protein
MKTQPPVPPANQSYQGTGDDKKADVRSRAPAKGNPSNLAEEGQQGNIRQNTRNQGYQQDR